MNMLEHQKLVLQNVAYNKERFRKEIYKSLDWLNYNEITQLYIWLRKNFWDTHSEIVQDTLCRILI
jgi:hypothetical protein